LIPDEGLRAALPVPDATAVLHTRIYIHPARPLRDVASARLTVRAIDVALAGVARRGARDEWSSPVEDTVGDLEAPDLRTTLAGDVDEARRTLRAPLEDPTLSLPELASALNGARALQTPGAGDAVALAERCRDFVGARADELRGELQRRMATALAEDDDPWAAADGVVNAAEATAGDLIGPPRGGDVPPAPALGWPARPGGTIQRLALNRPPKPAIVASMLLIGLGGYWVVAGVGMAARQVASTVVMPAWAAVVGAFLLLGAAGLYDRTAWRRDQRRQAEYLAMLVADVDGWIEGVLQWAGSELAPREIHAAIAAVRAELNAVRRAWMGARDAAERSRTVALSDWSTMAWARSICSADELDAFADRLAEEADPSACAREAAMQLDERISAGASGAGSTILSVVEEDITRAHRDAATAAVEPRLAAVRDALDEMLATQIWPQLTARTMAEMATAFGAGVDVWTFCTLPASLGGMAAPAPGACIAGPDDELTITTLAVFPRPILVAPEI
jgi:hypothetical protein